MLTFVHLDAEQSEQVDSRLENLFPLSLEVLHEVQEATYERKKEKEKENARRASLHDDLFFLWV